MTLVHLYTTQVLQGAQGAMSLVYFCNASPNLRPIHSNNIIVIVIINIVLCGYAQYNVIIKLLHIVVYEHYTFILYLMNDYNLLDVI